MTIVLGSLGTIGPGEDQLSIWRDPWLLCLEPEPMSEHFSVPLAVSPVSAATSSGIRVSVVIPAKNEARNIGWVLRRMPACVDEVIVVDGISTDGTLEVAKSIDPDVVVVHETRRGKGAALRAGFAAARGEYIVMIDADGSMDPLEIERYVQALEAGCDFAKGSRFLPGGGTDDMTLIRRIGNAALLGLTNLLYGRRYSELCYGFMAFRRSELLRLGLTADGFEIETQIVTRAVRHGLRVSEVPSVESPRLSGESNLNAVRDGLRVLRVILVERFAGVAPSSPQLVPIPVESTEDPAFAAPAANG